MKTIWTFLSAMLIIFLNGCGAPNGLERFELSGKVTFQGLPVPKGQVRLVPDNEAGNTGPGSIAEIVDGAYRTSEGNGVIGGAYKLQILGYETITSSDEDILFPDTPLFPLYEVKIDLEKADATINFEVPEQ